MKHRQMTPEQWFIANEPIGSEIWGVVRALPKESGILVLANLNPSQRRRLRHLARLRHLTVMTGCPGTAARVHNARELRNALLSRAPLVLLSPLYPTPSHPEWKPLPRMRAASLARLGRRRLLALGGMDSKRYARIATLGFIGWAGISAFRT